MSRRGLMNALADESMTEPKRAFQSLEEF